MSVLQDQATRLRQLVESMQSAPRPCRVIAVTSGKGGTGKSMFAVNLSVALTRAGKRVLLIDADFGLANVDLMLGVTPSRTLAQVLSGEITPQQALQVGAGGVQFLSGGLGVEALLDMDQEQAGAMMANLLQLQSDADIILIDTGAGAHPLVMRLVLAAEEAILVTTPEPTAAMDAYALVKTLSLKPGRLPALHLVVNRAESAKEARDISGAIIALAQKNLGMSISPLGSISMDAGVPAAIKRQAPLMITHPLAPASRDISQIARQLVGTAPAPQKQGFVGFLHQLVRPGARA